MPTLEPTVSPLPAWTLPPNPQPGTHLHGRTVDALLRWLGRRWWLRYGLRSRVIKRWCDPTTCAAFEFEAPFAGFVYPGDLSRWIDWLVYYFGGYELDELQLLRDLMHDRPGAWALDIGANVGHHALFLASFCEKVHAFEPFDDVARCIREKVARNRLQNIELHALGLGDADAELSYFAPADNNVGNGTFVSELAPLGRQTPSAVLTVRHADRYLQTLALPRLDLIKIDVEGFELHVLKGLTETLTRYRPLVMVELNDAARTELGSVDGLLKLLPPDYRVERIVRPRPVATFFSRRLATLEPLAWLAGPTPGGYVNLLLRPN